MKKTKIRISILLVVFFIVSVWTTNIIIENNKENTLKISLNNHKEILSRNYQMIMYDQKFKSSTIFERTFNNEKVLNILKYANNTNDEIVLSDLRDGLKKLLIDDYEIYKKDGILQFHFIFPNNVTFLRMHKPSKFGDDLSKVRLDIAWVNENRKELHGFHKGKTTHGFRHLRPIFAIDGTYLGVIDVSFTSGTLQDRLNNVNKLHTHFLVNKNIFNSKVWDRDNIKSRYLMSFESDDFMIEIGNHLSREKVLNNRDKFADIKDDISSNMKYEKEFSLIKYTDKYVAISYYPIKSLVSNEVSAWLVSYTKDENIRVTIEEAKNLLYVSIVLLFILYIFLFRILIQRHILDEQVKKQTQSLAKANKELNDINIIMKNQSKETINLLEQYKYTVDSALIVSKSNLEGIITFANDNFCRLSGYTRDELLGEPHSKLREKSVPKELFKELWNTIQSKNIWKGSYANKGKHSIYHVKATVAPILDINGEIIEYMSIREDITEQIELENKAKQLLNRSQEIMNSQDSLIIISSASEIIESNKKLFDITGLKDLDDFLLKHKCVCELFIPKDGYLKESTQDKAWFEPIFAKPNDIHKAIIKDIYTGKDIIFEVKANQITLDGNNFTIFTFSDITAVEKIREEAVASQKAKSDFLANMSHEIRTPMNGISGFLQLLEKTNLDAKQTKYLDITQSSMKTLLQIINDILDFSKIESGNMTSEMLDVNPFTDLYKSFMSFSAKADEKQIEYKINIDENLHSCYLMDQLHLHQVIQNLINNAMKFTPENGKISVNVQRIESINNIDKIKFSVVDTGIGIAKENQEKILQAFSQADNSTTRKFGGTGLGLSISKSLTTLMGGELKINSEENKGSEFYFELELEKSNNCEKINEILPANITLLFEEECKDSENVKSQLKSFEVLYSCIGTINEFEFKNKYNNIVITNSIGHSNKIKELYNNDIKIILLNEDNYTTKYKNFEIINKYNLNSSKLFNILLSYGLISNNLNSQNVIKKLNILIAEDYEINRILLEDILSQYENVTFKFVVNGQEAVDTILDATENEFDFIFMDINMPVLDGIEATKVIRQKDISTPIIALTANALEGDKEKFLSIGMNDYLSKPIDIDELDKIIKYYMIQKNDVLLEDMIEKEDERSNVKEITQEDIKNAINTTMAKMKFPEKIVMKLFNSYVNGATKLLIKYEEGLDTNNLELITKAAHDLKSSSQTLNFNDIGALAQTIESKSTNNDDFEYKESLEIFKTHFQKLQEYIANN